MHAGPGTAAHWEAQPLGGCPGGCSRPTYSSPSSTHRQFTGGREFFLFEEQQAALIAVQDVTCGMALLVLLALQSTQRSATGSRGPIVCILRPQGPTGPRRMQQRPT